MNTTKFRQLVLVAAVAAASSATTYWATRDDTPALTASAQAATTETEREVLYWYDPMMPGQRFDKPGKSPFMDMELVPKYADEGGSDTAAVSINPSVLQNFAVRTAVVERKEVTPSLSAAANVQFNERDVAVVQARSDGFVERTYGHAPSDVLTQGEPLVDLLIPAWGGAQEEFLAVLRTGDLALIKAARTRLRLTGMPAELIEYVEKVRQVQQIVTLKAPVSGMLKSLEVRQGMTLKAGATLATLNGLDTVWVEAAVPEIQAEQVAAGLPVEARLPAYPGETFHGQVIAVLPENDATSRTLRVRIELPNPELRLRPGMFASVAIRGPAQTHLQVPVEAVLRGGEYDYVLVAEDNGGFTPQRVVIGTESQGRVALIEGTHEGQRVVASGQFLIDSEASLAGALDRLGIAKAKGGASKDSTNVADTGGIHVPTMQGMNMPDMDIRDQGTIKAGPITGRGKVEAISSGQITLSHEPIPALGWPAMTMPFELVNLSVATGLQLGDSVTFTLQEGEVGYVIANLQVEGGVQ
ncbi:Cu(I)/Ag(I) efflux system membrane fusion protein [Modicisalibacter xianhensis]|jgi:Cu(I)/Ag(I) efflux system membrane fusion protein|uniref:Cu(I)/Ag(I) efflux system membrane fusion protein n=1 Tax=Modicisalibacter xianhensis TaxID=442341 RepID=A0A4R8FK39_9GAMM|nr:efflux RND transporter periplasmic adaptor subunit [Halomonas xianhensis]TDX22551.1 Cu(I)/Ag(I) efflux system membrane fusion protein [Halomonas xianhensis]